MYCKSAQRCRGAAVNADHLPDAILIQQFAKVEVSLNVRLRTKRWCRGGYRIACVWGRSRNRLVEVLKIIIAIIKPFKLEDVRNALNAIGVRE